MVKRSLIYLYSNHAQRNVTLRGVCAADAVEEAGLAVIVEAQGASPVPERASHQL